ncbi:fimbrial protein [Pseudomonas sp. NY15435]|uniref:fimbrial protein n=1 Tax=Pseudomonas sp. NY15435 TaxID=3400358 RepID=UPI003A8B4AA9
MGLHELYGKKWWFSDTLLLVVLVCSIVVLMSGKAMAAATCSGNPAADTFNFPPVISVPRDSTQVMALTGWVAGASATNWWSCNTSNDSNTGSAVFKPVSANSSYSDGGDTYTIWKTSKDGVGFVLKYNLYANGCGWAGWGKLVSSANAYAFNFCNSNGSVTNGGQVQIRLVQYGQITAGVLAGGELTRAVTYVDGNYGTQGGPKQFLASSVQFNVLMCQVDSVDLQLADSYVWDYASTTEVKKKPLQIQVKNCPSGMNVIRYELDPIGANIISSTNGTFSNQSGPGMAGGVGIRITDSTGINPVKFADPSYTLAGYSPTSGNSMLPINLNVAYYRTGTAAQVTPGQVVGLVQLTMLYL